MIVSSNAYITAFTMHSRLIFNNIALLAESKMILIGIEKIKQLIYIFDTFCSGSSERVWDGLSELFAIPGLRRAVAR